MSVLNFPPFSAAFRSRGGLARARLLGASPGVSVGKRVRVGTGVRLRLEPGSRLVIDDGCEIDDGSTLAASTGATLELRKGVFIGHHATIAARESIVVGPGTFLAELVSVRDHDHDPSLPPSSGENLVSPVHIGADSWIGAKATITRGVTIGSRVVVGANAVVTHDLPDAVVAVGIPAAVLKEHAT